MFLAIRSSFRISDALTSRGLRNIATIGYVNRLPAALAFMFVAALPWVANPAAAAGQEADRIIIKWRQADSSQHPASSARVGALGQRLGRELTRGRGLGGGMSVVHLTRGQRGTELAATLAALRADPDVELAEPDRRVKPYAVTPNDPLYSASLVHLGQSYDRQWYLKTDLPSAIRANEAWEITRGGASGATSPITVAVIDSGVRLTHPDLAAKFLPGYDFVSDSRIANDGDGWDSDPTDPGDFMTQQDLDDPFFASGSCGGGENSDQPTLSTWHGTRVAGMIGADTDNGVGMAGAAFHVRLLPIRVLGKCGGFESDVIAGMYWAAGMAPPPSLISSTSLLPNPNPAQVLNLSLGSEGACSAAYATAVRDITAHGVLVVASSGNDGARVGSPASCDGALAVTGIRHVGTKVGYSNLGPEVSIAAPAGNCVFIGVGDPCVYALNTTSNAGGQEPGADSYTTPLTSATYGTSFSTPLVSATAGLMKSVNPALTPALLIDRIRQSARAFPTVSDTMPQPPACVLPSVTAVQGFECICNTQVCGAGMLDAERAVIEALRPAVLVATSGTIGSGRTITLDGSASAAATGRTLVSYQWTVASTSGGAGAPAIQSANQSIARVTLPVSGTVTLRLTATDNLGGQAFADVVLTTSGGSSSSPPPSTGGTGGGGSLGIPAALALLFFFIHNTRRRIRNH